MSRVTPLSETLDLTKAPRRLTLARRLGWSLLVVGAATAFYWILFARRTSEQTASFETSQGTEVPGMGFRLTLADGWTVKERRQDFARLALELSGCEPFFVDFELGDAAALPVDPAALERPSQLGLEFRLIQFRSRWLSPARRSKVQEIVWSTATNVIELGNPEADVASFFRLEIDLPEDLPTLRQKHPALRATFYLSGRGSHALLDRAEALISTLRWPPPEDS